MLARFDSATGRLHRKPLWAFLPHQRHSWSGWYKSLGGKFCALYVNANELCFWCDGKHLVLNDEVKTTLQESGSERMLDLESRGTRINLSYRRPTPWPELQDDPTAFVEEEQFDFGLFVFRAATDERKRSLIIAAGPGAP